MSQANIIRAWKDEEYRLSLSEAERAALPANPAGLTGLTDAEMADVDGGAVNVVLLWTLICWGG
jgi:mersacidin/lichenicidin family type 2 lantibiotic